MWRYRATCCYCWLRSRWNQDRELSEREILVHLRNRHGVIAPLLQVHYRLDLERQCDFCPEPFLDECCICGKDYCRLHAGDIDGRCIQCG